MRRFVFLFFCLFWGSPWMKRRHGEMYTTLGRDSSGGSRSEIIVFLLPRANDIFFILRSQECIVRT